MQEIYNLTMHHNRITCKLTNLYCVTELVDLTANQTCTPEADRSD